jgi:hypothetical protein
MIAEKQHSTTAKATQGDNHSFVQTFVSFGVFLCGRDLGLLGMFGALKRDERGSFVSSLPLKLSFLKSHLSLNS